AKVGLAQVAERLTGLRSRQEQRERDQRQRESERNESELHLRGVVQRLLESQRARLQAGSTLAALAVDKGLVEIPLGQHAERRDTLRQERQRLAERVQANRQTWLGKQEQVHARELAVNELRHRRETSIERLRED